MIYKAHLKQHDKGCGQTVIDIPAKNIDEARQRLFKEIKENYTGENELKSCEIYEVQEIHEINLVYWYMHMDAIEKSLKEKQKEEEERREFERLKAKFGNK
jgi:prenyltransferase beta subunit